jgi:hypothetical protein
MMKIDKTALKAGLARDQVQSGEAIKAATRATMRVQQEQE